MRGLHRARVLGFLVVALAAACFVGACGESDEGSGGGAASSGGGKVSIAYLNDFGAANVYTLPDCVKDKGSEVELVPFTQFADVQRALSSGQTDLGVMGFQNLAQMVGNNFTDFKAIAGVYTGGEHITLGKGVQVNSWKDFAGKKVGVPPNSFVDMLFRAGATSGGLDLDSVDFVSFPGAGPAMLSALEKGSIDVMVAWETNNAQAKAKGIGDYSPTVDLQQGSIGKATSVMYATDSAISGKKQAIQAVVDCLAEQTQKLGADKQAWAQAAAAKTGVTPDVANIAVNEVTMDTNLYEQSAAKIIKTFAKFGLVKDVGADLPNYFDYSFLEQATGKSAADLGQS